MEYGRRNVQYFARPRGESMTEFHYAAKDAVPITVIADAYGSEVSLVDNGTEVSYLLISEFRLGETDYAVLQPNQPKGEDEMSLFRIIRDETGNLELETII